MLKRIFVAINLPEECKETLDSYRKAWPDLPASWTEKANLHITLQFLGNVLEKEFQHVIDQLRAIGERHAPLEWMLCGIVYAPVKSRPTMIWVMVDKNPLLITFQKDIQKTLSRILTVEKYAFIPHLTLAKLRQLEFQKLEPEEWPIIEEDMSLPFPVTSFEVMESKLYRTGPKYEIIESIPLRALS